MEYQNTISKYHYLLIDNYDSFSYNLVELLRSFDNIKISVLKNDDLAIFRDEYDAIIISPGPGLPYEAAFLEEAIDYYKGRIPIFGICLGLQAIVKYYGGELIQLDTVFHGIRDRITHFNESVLFQGIPTSFFAGRYHSWVADLHTFPSDLIITAEDNHGEIMAVENKKDLCFAVQFHPESFMTQYGKKMFANFIALTHEFHQKKKEVSFI